MHNTNDPAISETLSDEATVRHFAAGFVGNPTDRELTAIRRWCAQTLAGQNFIRSGGEFIIDASEGPST